MAKYEMGERVDPRPRKRGMLLGGGLDQYSGHYGNVSWEEGVDDWDSEETSGGGQVRQLLLHLPRSTFPLLIRDIALTPYSPQQFTKTTVLMPIITPSATAPQTHPSAAHSRPSTPNLNRNIRVRHTTHWKNLTTTKATT